MPWVASGSWTALLSAPQDSGLAKPRREKLIIFPETQILPICQNCSIRSLGVITGHHPPLHPTSLRISDLPDSLLGLGSNLVASLSLDLAPQRASLPVGGCQSPRRASLTCSVWWVLERSLSRPVAVPGACCRASCPGLPEEVLTNCWWAFSILVSCPIPHPHLPTLELPGPPSLWQPVLSLS